jgi:galactonate dehydratase
MVWAGCVEHPAHTTSVSVPAMRITQIETLRLGEFPNLLFVTVATDEGLTGLGETFFGAAAVEAYVHETAAPYLLGRDPRDVERHSAALSGYVGFSGTGAEQRGRSALDIALWDLLGQAAGQPLSRMLGGASRESVPIYNTCAGPRYIRAEPVQAVDNWGLASSGGGEDGRYEDLDAFLTDAGALARGLLSEGITGMKIWPFDPYAEASGGTSISARELDSALEPFLKIRDAVGGEMAVMAELHGLWDVPPARRILKELEALDVCWCEDPVRPDNVHGLAEVARATSVPIAAGETLAGRRAFRELFDRSAIAVAVVDLSWCGGLSEARKIGTLAETYGLSVAPHDCTGPVVLTASTHLSLHLPNVPLQETVRAYHRGWYGDLVTVLPAIADGRITVPGGPGLGTSLRPEVRERRDAIVRASLPS